MRTAQNLVKAAHDTGFHLKLTSAARDVQLAIQGFENEGKNDEIDSEFCDSFILPSKSENKKTQP